MGRSFTIFEANFLPTEAFLKMIASSPEDFVSLCSCRVVPILVPIDLSAGMDEIVEQQLLVGLAVCLPLAHLEQATGQRTKQPP
jgi:hypothetical protein